MLSSDDDDDDDDEFPDFNSQVYNCTKNITKEQPL